MTNDCKTCPVSTGTHKPAEALHQQIDEPQAEAMRLADECEESATHWVHEIDTRAKAAKLLRAQQARIAELEAQLAAPHPLHQHLLHMLGAKDHEEAGCIIARLHALELAAAPQAVQAAVPQLKANCYSNDNGDYWRDRPDDSDFVDGLKVGDTYELQASIRSWPETFRVTKAPDETSDDYEVELVSSAAPAHPAEGVPAPMPVAHPHHCTARTADGSCEECEGHAQAMAEWNAERTALAATQPAAQELDAQDAARYRFIKKHSLILSGGTREFGWPISPFGVECDRYIDKELAAQAKQGD